MLKFIIPYHPQEINLDADIEYTEKECIVRPRGNTVEIGKHLEIYNEVRVEAQTKCGLLIMNLDNWLEEIKEVIKLCPPCKRYCCE